MQNGQTFTSSHRSGNNRAGTPGSVQPMPCSPVVVLVESFNKGAPRMTNQNQNNPNQKPGQQNQAPGQKPGQQQQGGGQKPGQQQQDPMRQQGQSHTPGQKADR